MILIRARRSLVPLMLTQDSSADELLDRDPLALLLGMLLDQQVPMERAFAAPYLLKQRLGGDLDVHELADYDPDALAQLFAGPPALHRYPKSMAVRVQDLCRSLVKCYGGDVTALWRGVSDAREVVGRLRSPPGDWKEKGAKFFGRFREKRKMRGPRRGEGAGPLGGRGGLW